MSYEKLFYLKFVKGIPTCRLMQYCPVEQVSEIALLDLPLAKWEKLRFIKNKKHFSRLLQLKRKFLGDPNFESY